VRIALAQPASFVSPPKKEESYAYISIQSKTYTTQGKARQGKVRIR